MTIDQIFGYSTEELDAMSDQQLEVLLGENFNYTRPERFDLGATVKKQIKEKAKETSTESSEPKAPKEKKEKLSQKDRLRQLMIDAGMDPDAILKPKPPIEPPTTEEPTK